MCEFDLQERAMMVEGIGTVVQALVDLQVAMIEDFQHEPCDFTPAITLLTKKAMIYAGCDQQSTEGSM